MTSLHHHGQPGLTSRRAGPSHPIRGSAESVSPNLRRHAELERRMSGNLDRESAPPANDGAWLLLAELNHRIGNELQAAVAALRLARRGIPEGAPRARFIEKAMMRLECFGDVHHILDRQRGQPPLAQRLEALCHATAVSKAAPVGINVGLALEDVTVDEETAWT